eukprot:364059-Chlamydomonas_euryale.AAC.4
MLRPCCGSSAAHVPRRAHFFLLALAEPRFPAAAFAGSDFLQQSKSVAGSSLLREGILRGGYFVSASSISRAGCPPKFVAGYCFMLTLSMLAGKRWWTSVSGPPERCRT